MTLNDILVAALMQLDRGHDAQTLDIWRDKLTRFANDAMAELCTAVKPKRTEVISAPDNTFLIGDLERDCVKLISVKKNGKELSFLAEPAAGRVILSPTADRTENVEVTYQCMPMELSSPTDVPELPAQCHPLIVTYVVGRERASGDPAAQRGANVYFQMFQAGKATLKPHFGDVQNYRILNRW